MLTNNIKMIKDAQQKGYAIPAINTQGGNYDIIRAICRAAEAMGSPVILAHYVNTGAYSGNDWFVEVCKWVAKEVSVPVSIHLDHGDSFELCMHALKLGFTSLMIDGSAKPVAENAKITNEVIRVAQAFDVPVEAEIGELLRLDNTGKSLENKNTADVEEVREFLSMCRPDTLALGIGNAHGYYNGTPDIKIEILDQVRRFSDIPFVLHGCTGMDEDTVRLAIKAGVCKINLGTHIRYKYVEYIKEGIETMDHNGHSWQISQYASQKLEQDIRDIILLSGSDGKA